MALVFLNVVALFSISFPNIKSNVHFLHRIHSIVGHIIALVYIHFANIRFNLIKFNLGFGFFNLSCIKERSFYENVIAFINFL